MKLCILSLVIFAYAILTFLHRSKKSVACKLRVPVDDWYPYKKYR